MLMVVLLVGLLLCDGVTSILYPSINRLLVEVGEAYRLSNLVACFGAGEIRISVSVVFNDDRQACAFDGRVDCAFCDLCVHGITF